MLYTFLHHLHETMTKAFTRPTDKQHEGAVKKYAEVFLNRDPVTRDNNLTRFDFQAKDLVGRYAKANGISKEDAIKDIEERMNFKEVGKVAVQGPFTIRNGSNYEKLTPNFRGKVMDFAYPNFNKGDTEENLNLARAKIKDAIKALGPNDVLIQILPRDYIKDLTLADQNYVRNTLVKIYEQELENAGKKKDKLILVDPGTDKNASLVTNQSLNIQNGVDAISLMQDVVASGRMPVLSNNSASRNQPGNGAAGFGGQTTVDECIARQMHNPFMGKGTKQGKFLADMIYELERAKQPSYQMPKSSTMEKNSDNEKCDPTKGTLDEQKVRTMLGEIGKKNTTHIKHDKDNNHFHIKVAEGDVLETAYILHSKGYKVNVPEDMKKEFEDYIKEQDAKKSKTDKVEPKKGVESPEDKLKKTTKAKGEPEEDGPTTKRKLTKVQELENRRTQPTGQCMGKI